MLDMYVLKIPYLFITSGEYWIGLEPMYQMIKQYDMDDNVSYGLDIEIWTTQGEQFVARYEHARCKLEYLYIQ